MLRKLPKSIFLLGMILASQLISAQIELKADGGSFEDLTPWNEGYLGVVQTQAYAVIPKFRQFQYFDKSGEMKWNEKITPFNFNNVSICNPEAEYAYFINMPFGKTAALEKTSKTEFLNIHQIDQSGKVIEKSITYTNELKPLAGYLKDMSKCYIGATKDGFVIVVTNDNLKYHVVRVDSKLNTSYQAIDLEWNEKLFNEGKLSKPKFVLGATNFTIIQLKLVDNKIETTMKTMKLENISTLQTTVNHISFDGYSLFSKNGYEIEYSFDERQFIDHTREEWKGNTIYYIPTLGSFLEFVYLDDQLKSYAYFKNVTPNTKTVEKEGFVLYNLNTTEETTIEPNFTFYIDGENKGSKEHGIHIGKEDEFVLISLQEKENLLLVTSSGIEKKYTEKVSIAQIFASYVSSKAINASTEIDVVSKTGDHYIGMDFEGIKNSFGNTKRVTIYEY